MTGECGAFKYIEKEFARPAFYECQLPARHWEPHQCWCLCTWSTSCRTVHEPLGELMPGREGHYLPEST